MTPLGSVLGPGERAFDASLTVANEFRLLPGLTEDAETARLALRGRWGLCGGREFFAELPVIDRGGGLMDPVIEWWHASTGNPPRGRDVVPRGRSIILEPGSQEFGSALAVGDVTFGFGKQLNGRTHARMAVKLPTGNPALLAGSGGVDAGLSLGHEVPIAAGWDLYLQGGLVAQSPASRLPSARGLVEQATVSLGYAPNGRDRFVVQWDSEASATVTGVSAVDAAHRTMTFAYRRKLSEHGSLELFFAEDGDWGWLDFPGGPDVGPDFTVGLRFTSRP